MNIYEKLQAARVSLKEMDIKKSGVNTFAKYTYYELDDIQPAITKICCELKLCPIVTFSTETAVLTIYDVEKPDDFIIFTSPMVESEVKGASKIQSLGATETYQRRYLYLAAFDISERDANDKTTTDLSLHNIFSIKERIEKLITEKVASGTDIERIYKATGLGESRFKSMLNYFSEVDRVEKVIKKL